MDSPTNITIEVFETDSGKYTAKAGLLEATAHTRPKALARFAVLLKRSERMHEALDEMDDTSMSLEESKQIAEQLKNGDFEN